MMASPRRVVIVALFAAASFSVTGFVMANALTTPSTHGSVGQHHAVTARPAALDTPYRRHAPQSQCEGRRRLSAASPHQCALSRDRATLVVGGHPAGLLYPGISRPLNLTFLNLGSRPLRLRRRAISPANITITSLTRGCPSSWFAVTRGLTAAVTVPSGHRGPVSLKTLGVPQGNWPVVTMRETHTNQDACQGAKLWLTFSGIEATP